MKAKELVALGKCARCGKGLCPDVPLFWRVRVDRWVLNLNVIRRRHGLALQLGSEELAEVMGTDEHVAAIVPESEFTLAYCEKCSSEVDSIVRHPW